MKNKNSIYQLRRYRKSDYDMVIDNVVSKRYIDKYLNKGFLFSTLSLLNIIHSEFYILENNKNQIVAAGVIRAKFNIKKLRRNYWLYDIEVKTDYRGLGIGRELMNKLIALCRERNFKEVYVKVDTENKIAQNLYFSLGFESISLKNNNYNLILKLNEL